MTQHAITLIPVSRIRHNKYNPNRMTEEEFAEYVAEVRHLGRPPKPTIVRRTEDEFEIVDGEHGWRAAQEVGLTEIACEIIEVDDFEAMRQTYKRNQHGAHNPVLLGKMFSQMMADKGLSQRRLAEEIGVSEGTIRNALEYAKAAEVRNDYALDELSVKQVRLFNRLPQTIGGWWLDAGADLRDLFGVKWAEQAERSSEWKEKAAVKELAGFEESGLVEFITPVRSRTAFVDALKKLREWDKWESSWCRNGVERKVLREYTKHYFGNVWYVRKDHMMDDALSLVLDPKTGTFVLTPEEFADCIEAVGEESASAHDFQERLELAVQKKGLELPENKYTVKRQLRQLEIDKEAPDFIKDSSLDVDTKFALLEEYRNDPKTKTQAIRYIAEHGMRRLRGESDFEVVRRHIKKFEKQQEDEQRWREWADSKSEMDLANEIVDGYYDDKDDDLKESLRGKLAMFTKAELLALREIVFRYEEFQLLTATIRALSGCL